ncbi:MAG: site-specific DNA-methyltransferase, partial [Nanoarchaeota archaeon]|nr:site-specific DNA-methyltransferase [Nanoarchaeota archaeon]
LTVADPPYGINVVPDSGNIGWSTKQAKVSKFSKVINDDKLMDVSFLLDTAEKVAIFGGQYFSHYLPKAGRWLVWDKDFTDSEADFVPFSACELVWSNIPGVSVKKYKCRSMGYSREGESGSRQHPNQKPVKVISGIITDFSGDDRIIYDPFLGSGTTMVACQNLNRKCRGIEISENYCAVILQRMTDMGLKPELIT